MEAQYIVAVSRGSGIIGILTERDIRRGLAAGSLQPTHLCLPARATGDVAAQWRPLGAVFGLPHPGGAEDASGPPFEAAAALSADSPTPGGCESVAELIRKVGSREVSVERPAGEA